VVAEQLLQIYFIVNMGVTLFYVLLERFIQTVLQVFTQDADLVISEKMTTNPWHAFLVVHRVEGRNSSMVT
jgi:hypothetical protein